MGCRKNSPARRSTFTNEMFVFHFFKIAPSHHVARLLLFFDISIGKRDATTFTFAHPKTKETGLLRNSRDQVKIYVLFKKKDKWIERLTWLLSTSMIIGSAFYDDERSFSLVFFFSPFFQPQTNNALLLQSNPNHDGVDGGRRDAMASKHNLWWTTFLVFLFFRSPNNRWPFPPKWLRQTLNPFSFSPVLYINKIPNGKRTRLMTPRPSNYPLINRVGNYYWLTTPPEAQTTTT